MLVDVKLFRKRLLQAKTKLRREFTHRIVYVGVEYVISHRVMLRRELAEMHLRTDFGHLPLEDISNLKKKAKKGKFNIGMLFDLEFIHTEDDMEQSVREISYHDIDKDVTNPIRIYKHRYCEIGINDLLLSQLKEIDDLEILFTNSELNPVGLFIESEFMGVIMPVRLY